MSKCEFCTFKYGVAKTSTNKEELFNNFIWEIRPNNNGKYMILVRLFSKDNRTIKDKSVIFITYCPKCGRKL